MRAHGIEHQLSRGSVKEIGVRRGGMVGSDITTHWTEARVSLPFVRELAVAQLNARPVNSGVRLLTL